MNLLLDPLRSFTTTASDDDATALWLGAEAMIAPSWWRELSSDAAPPAAERAVDADWQVI
ncbi:MAG: hypothetical protein KF903_05420 [Dokdonella sp.]|uniref:hypothetical protein n=1 Tax=Dokdonella sp. TaxID=2291710 RepID=UPI0025C7026A|nr:hypothetical protein [Dokdonella sp.]MBX3700424.1 hypothetical protein [Dokdonella sp.]